TPTSASLRSECVCSPANKSGQNIGTEANQSPAVAAQGRSPHWRPSQTRTRARCAVPPSIGARPHARISPTTGRAPGKGETLWRLGRLRKTTHRSHRWALPLGSQLDVGRDGGFALQESG